MKMAERFKRQNEEDQVIIGELISQTMRGRFGEVFRLMVENLKSMEVSNSRNGVGNADRVLGRLEAYETVLGDIEGFITRLQDLQRPVDRDESETELASEQLTPLRGGEI